jgi:hypothetical protein
MRNSQTDADDRGAEEDAPRRWPCFADLVAGDSRRPPRSRGFIPKVMSISTTPEQGRQTGSRDPVHAETPASTAGAV